MPHKSGHDLHPRSTGHLLQLFYCLTHAPVPPRCACSTSCYICSILRPFLTRPCACGRHEARAHCFCSGNCITSQQCLLFSRLLEHMLRCWKSLELGLISRCLLWHMNSWAWAGWWTNFPHAVQMRAACTLAARFSRRCIAKSVEQHSINLLDYMRQVLRRIDRLEIRCGVVLLTFSPRDAWFRHWQFGGRHAAHWLAGIGRSTARWVSPHPLQQLLKETRLYRRPRPWDQPSTFSALHMPKFCRSRVTSARAPWKMAFATGFFVPGVLRHCTKFVAK